MEGLIEQFQTLFDLTALLAALVVGYIIKHTAGSDRVTRFIPLVCAVVGIVVVCIGDASGGALNVESVIGGAISGLSATGFYEAFTNLVEGPKGGDGGYKIETTD